MSAPPEAPKPDNTPPLPEVESAQTSKSSNEAPALEAPALEGKPSQGNPSADISQHRVKWAPIIAVGATAGFIICTVGHFSSVVPQFARTTDVIEASKNIFEMAAIAAGGAWAYFKFIKGRTFQETLAPSVSGEFKVIDSVQYILVTTQIKNIGLSKVEFDRKECLLNVVEYTASDAAKIDKLAELEAGPGLAVLDPTDRYVEPNETIEDQHLILVPGTLGIAYRLKVQIKSTAGHKWRSSCVVDKSSLESGKTSVEVSFASDP